MKFSYNFSSEQIELSSGHIVVVVFDTNFIIFAKSVKLEI